MHAVAAEYPHSTLNGTAICSRVATAALRNMETHVAGRRNLNVYMRISGRLDEAEMILMYHIDSGIIEELVSKTSYIHSDMLLICIIDFLLQFR